MRTVILERRSVSFISRATDALAASYSQFSKMGAAGQGGHADRSSSVPENRPQQPSGRETEQERLQLPAASAAGRFKGPASDSEGSTQPEDFDGGLQASAGGEGGQGGAPSGSPLVPDSSSSVTVSPDEMSRLVFAIVEEEMAGNLPYLVSVIVEFLKRLGLSLWSSSTLLSLSPPHIYIYIFLQHLDLSILLGFKV